MKKMTTLIVTVMFLAIGVNVFADGIAAPGAAAKKNDFKKPPEIIDLDALRAEEARERTEAMNKKLRAEQKKTQEATEKAKEQAEKQKKKAAKEALKAKKRAEKQKKAAEKAAAKAAKKSEEKK